MEPGSRLELHYGAHLTQDECSTLAASAVSVPSRSWITRYDSDCDVRTSASTAAGEVAAWRGWSRSERRQGSLGNGKPDTCAWTAGVGGSANKLCSWWGIVALQLALGWLLRPRSASLRHKLAPTRRRSRPQLTGLGVSI